MSIEWRVPVLKTPQNWIIIIIMLYHVASEFFHMDDREVLCSVGSGDVFMLSGELQRKNRFRLSGKCRLTGIFQQKHVVTLVVNVSRMCMARSCHMPLHIVGGSSRGFIFQQHGTTILSDSLRTLKQNAGRQQPQVRLAHFEHLPLLTMDIFSQNSMVLSSKILEPETCIGMMPEVRRFVLALNFRTFTMPTMGLGKYTPVLS